LLVTCAVVAPMIWPAALPRAAWITGICSPRPAACAAAGASDSAEGEPGPAPVLRNRSDRSH
jgi:hypothetical protein